MHLHFRQSIYCYYTCFTQIQYTTIMSFSLVFIPNFKVTNSLVEKTNGNGDDDGVCRKTKVLFLVC